MKTAITISLLVGGSLLLGGFSLGRFDEALTPTTKTVAPTGPAERDAATGFTLGKRMWRPGRYEMRHGPNGTRRTWVPGHWRYVSRSAKNVSPPTR